MFLQKFFSRTSQLFAARTKSELQPVVKDARQDRLDRMTGKVKPAPLPRTRREDGVRPAHEQLKTNSPLNPRPLRGLA